MWSPSPDEWNRIEPLVDQLLTLPPEERTPFIDEHLSSSRELKEWVERLVDGAADPDWLVAVSPALVSGALGAPRPHSVVEDGATIGPFRVIREIGRGGSGRVYHAERAFGTFTQRVALKVVPSALGSASLRRRFMVEQKLLARLEHPNVARLVDAGVRDDGLPWFAMEFVDGLRIDQWCDQQRLDTAHRLELFLSVCDAVQAAHQRLVVHRDLKPSNIFVASDGTVRLLDFGVATLLERDATDEDEATRPEDRMFTPEYAAPEQWRQEPATTATDTYALGVILYQLLVGRRPFHLEARPRGDWGRIVSEEEPPVPSSVVAEAAAAARGTTADRLARRLRGDLDAILLKALRADPALRYPTARELADDLRRHLDGTPVRAREDRWSYRASRFLGRNRVAVVGVAAVLVTSVAGAGVALWQADRATRAAEEATAVTRFLSGLFEQGSPLEARGDTLTASDMLQRASQGVDSMFPNQPLLRAQVLRTVAGISRDLGRLDHADTLARRALAITDSVRPPGLHTVLSLGLVGGIASARDELPQADTLLRRALDLARSVGAHDTVRAHLLDSHASVLFRMENFPDAERADREALRLGSALGPVFRGLVTGNIAMAVSAQTQEAVSNPGREAEAAVLYREALAIYRDAQLTGHPDYLGTLSNMATMFFDRERPDSARPMLVEALAGLERIYAADHERVVSAVNNLAQADLSLGNAAAAEAGFVRARANALAVHGPDHFLSLIPWYNMGKAQLDGGQPERAAATFRGVLGQLKTREGIDGRLAFGTWLALGRALSAQGRYREVLSVLDSAAAIQSVLPPNSAALTEIPLDRANALSALGRHAEAERLAREVLTWRRANMSQGGNALVDATYTLARVIMAGERTPARRQEALALAGEAKGFLSAEPWRTVQRASIDSAVARWQRSD